MALACPAGEWPGAVIGGGSGAGRRTYPPLIPPVLGPPMPQEEARAIIARGR
jgi:hypothetical protein